MIKAVSHFSSELRVLSPCCAIPELDSSPANRLPSDPLKFSLYLKILLRVPTSKLVSIPKCRTFRRHVSVADPGAIPGSPHCRSLAKNPVSDGSPPSPPSNHGRSTTTSPCQRGSGSFAPVSNQVFICSLKLSAAVRKWLWACCRRTSHSFRHPVPRSRCGIFILMLHLSSGNRTELVRMPNARMKSP